MDQLMKEQELDDMLLLVDNNADDDEFLLFDRGDSNCNSLFDNLDLITPKDSANNNQNQPGGPEGGLIRKSTLQKKGTIGGGSYNNADIDSMRKFKSEHIIMGGNSGSQ